MRVFLITGNPGSGKSTLAAELSLRGMIAIDTDDLAFWEDVPECRSIAVQSPAVACCTPSLGLESHPDRSGHRRIW